MLTYLAIRDFAIVDSLEVELDEGFSVITGETGAGKSILVSAIQMLLGGRAAPDMIRTDQDSAEVEGCFRLDAGSGYIKRLESAGLAQEDQLTIRRVISRSGKNRVFVNDRAVTLGLLSDLTRGLLDISGQHEHVALTDEDTQLEILDAFGGLQRLQQQVKAEVEQLQILMQDRKALQAQERQRAEREDYLRFSIQRIDEIQPRAQEDQELEKERLRLRNVEKLAEGFGQIYEQLYQREGSVVELLGKSRTTLSSLVRFDAELESKARDLEAMLRQVEDFSRELGSALSGVNADPSRLEQIEERLRNLRALERSFGPTLAEVIDKREKLEQEIHSLESLAERMAQLEAACDKTRQSALDRASELSKNRRKAGADLAKRLQKELRSLAMPGAKVEVSIQSTGPETLSVWGLDRVCFLLSANAGEEVRSMSRVASGGELSRVLLALKVVLAKVDPVPTYVFDEVDSGVGGGVAEIIGRMLAAVSLQHQVLCITHLPQIAALASRHYQVNKYQEKERTVSAIRLLNSDERVEEVARMVAGSVITDQARSHAREMLRIGGAGSR